MTNTSSPQNRHIYRFAPLLDRFVLSIIYKDCDSDADTRKFFTAVNWLFTAEEADALFSGDFRLNFSRCIMHSQSILSENGYRFPENPPIHQQKSDFSNDLQTALMSAVFHSDIYAAKNYQSLQMQTFVGLDREESLFDALFWILDLRPQKMRKHLSFCIGAISARETYGVALVLMYNDILSPIVVSGNFNGAMLINKLIFLNKAFRMGSQIPTKAKAFAKLPESVRIKAKELFDESQESANYWTLIELLSTNDEKQIIGAAFVKLIGSESFIKHYNRGDFSKEQLVKIYKERDEIFNMPDVLEILRSTPGVVETAEKEIAEEKAQAEKEAAAAAALKKSRGLFHRKAKNTKDKNANSDEKKPEKDEPKPEVLQDNLDDDKSDSDKKASSTFVDDDYILESDKKNERKHKKDKERSDFAQDHLDDDRYVRDKDRKHESHKKNVDKKNNHADNDNKEHREHDSASGKHSQNSNFKSKFENLLKFFAYVGEVIEDIWDEFIPIFIPIVILLFAAAFGVGMYFIGIKIIPLIPAFLARFAYGIQLTLLVTVSLLCGCALKGKIEDYLNKEKRKKRSSSKED